MTKEQQPIKKSQKIITIVEVALVVLCIIVSILVITNSNKIKDDGSAKYAKFMTVQSDSMDPTFNENAVVITKRPDEDPNHIYDLGTIVTFVDNEGGLAFFNTHRIVGYRYIDSGGTGIFYLIEGSQETYEDFKEVHPDLNVTAYITRGDKYTEEVCGSVNGNNGNYGIDKNGNHIGINEGKNDSPLIPSGVVAVYKNHIGGVGGILKFFRSIWGFLLVVILPLFALLIINVVGVVKLILKSKVEKVRAESAIDELATKRQAIEEFLLSQGLSAEEARAKALEQVPIPTLEEPSTEEPSTEEPSTEEPSVEEKEEK